jgi:carboxyl-terminal processing protease
MKKASGFLVASIAATLLVGPFVTGAPEPDYRKVASSVGDLLEKAHFSKKRLDDSVSKLFLKNYLEHLDYNHLFFTQKDVDNFAAKYATSLDDEISAGNTKPGMEIYEVFKKRVDERVVKVKELLKEKYDFTGTRSVELRRDKAPWPKDSADADRIWRDRVEGELLDRTLINDKINPPIKVITKRYENLVKNLAEQTQEEIVSNFLKVLAETYDPHSEYMSRSELDSFNINMRLSLVGIGAVLTQDEGYTKIRELVVGGPASKEGHLKVGDRISAVAQGDSEFVEAVDMRLDKVVEMIRGKKDTKVRLRVIPVTSTDPSDVKIIEITRAEVKLTDQEAKAEIVERPMPDGSTQRIGWIILPSFYADMGSRRSDAKSTTKDVLVLLKRLKEEKVDGLVMDLRRNGGGSLEEAVNLTGLFIKSGYVVVAQDTDGRPSKLRDTDPSVAYDGPMVVLTNKLSASASEIFAAALQDYNRAVIVGDSSTFGKGTVQTMVDISNIISMGSGAGALKLTIQKFYRVSGGSTQLRGVISDIKLPSLWDQSDIGESSLKGPLGYDTIEPVSFDKLDKNLFVQNLKQKSAVRVSADPEFKWIMEDAERIKKRVAENKISLNEATRKAETEADKVRKEARKAERAKHPHSDEKVYSVTLANAAKPELELKVEKKIGADGIAPKDPNGPTPAPEPKVEPKIDPKADPKTEAKPAAKDDDDEDGEDEVESTPRVDPIRNETLNIVADLIQFNRVPPTPVQDKTALKK